MTSTLIVVADSGSIFGSAVRAVLANEVGFEVHEAHDLSSLIASVELEPEIVLIDHDLRPQGGIEAVQELRKRCDARLIIWSFHPTFDAVLEAFEAGADGYLDKSTPRDALVRALRGMSDGQAPLPRDLTSQLIEELRRLKDRERARERSSTLSERERDVLRLVTIGYSNKRVAAELSISEFTVKRHVQNILAKLNGRSRREAAAIFRIANGVTGPSVLSDVVPVADHLRTA